MSTPKTHPFAFGEYLPQAVAFSKLPVRIT
jgi:hypothetical protein